MPDPKNPPPATPAPTAQTLMPDPQVSPTPSLHVPPELAQHPKFRILRELGRGGMGVVYLAEHRIMEKPVALKVISAMALEHPDALTRFHGEARAAGKLDHPNIARAYDADQAGPLHFLVMEFVEGISLAQRLEQEGPLPVGMACYVARQAALGLQHAFELGMVHRDIKPQNLMLTPRGQVKILDFGLARLRSEQTGGDRLTRMNTFMGTPEFVAPEQATDARQADIRADIYSLGCTLYALVTGRPPFVEDTPVLLVLAHLEKEPRPLREVCAAVPPKLSAVVARMLAKDPAQRFAEPREVAQALLPFIQATDKAAAALPVVLPVAETMTGGATRPMKGPGKGATPGPVAEVVKLPKQPRPAEMKKQVPPPVRAVAEVLPEVEAAEPIPWWQHRLALGCAISGVLGLAVLAVGVWLGVTFLLSEKTGGDQPVTSELAQQAEDTTSSPSPGNSQPGPSSREERLIPNRGGPQGTVADRPVGQRPPGGEAASRGPGGQSPRPGARELRRAPASVERRRSRSADRAEVGSRAVTEAGQRRPMRTGPTPGFELLFNGKDTAGWFPVESSVGISRWEVVDGVLTGTNSGKHLTDWSYLTTEHRAYENFELHCELLPSTHNRTAVSFRDDGAGYVVGIAAADEKPGDRFTGSLYLRSKDKDNWFRERLATASAPVPALAADRPIQLAVIAQGSHLEVRLDGVVVVSLVDKKNRFGGISLLCPRDGTVRFRKIEFKRLPGEKSAGSP